jgi:hypothetical protein
MLMDINDWILSLSIWLLEIHEYKNEIESEYWKREVIFDLKSQIEKSRHLCETCQEELLDIRQDITREVKRHHLTRLGRLAEEAYRLNSGLSRAWSRKYYAHDNQNFRPLEDLYVVSRGAMADLIDLGNLCVRLEDFLGKENTELSGRLPDILENILRAICGLPNNFYFEDNVEETKFRDYVLVVLNGMGYNATAEPRRRVVDVEEGKSNEGFVDILVEEERCESIIEFKVWGRSGYKKVVDQVLGYGTPWTTEYITVMMNPNRGPIFDQYKEYISENSCFLGFVKDEMEYSPIQKIVSLHQDMGKGEREIAFQITNFVINLSLLE